MIIMSQEMEVIQPQRIFRRRLNIYWALTVLICAITASLLSYFGYIMYNPITSFIMGGGIGLIYVLFEEKYWAHVRSHVFRNKALIARFEKEKKGGE